MTTTPSPELPDLDLDRLEALARAATPGIWEAQRHGVIVAGPMRQYTNGSARSQIANFTGTFHEDDHEDEPCRKQANAEFCAALRPEVAKQLIALARRAQPEGEAPRGAEAQVFFDGAWKPASEKAFYCTSEQNRRVVDRPEGEAPQAEPNAFSETATYATQLVKEDLKPAMELFAPAAQHAESGAQARDIAKSGYVRLRELLETEFACYRTNAGLIPWAINALIDNSPHRAAQSQGAQAIQIFTCKGKGGDYELVGYSNGAGPKRGESIVVYRDITMPDVFFHRVVADFGERMEWLGARAALAAKAEAPATGDLTLLASLADAADVFMNGGVAPLRPLIDRAKAVTSGAQQAAAPGALDESAYQRGYLDGMAKGRRDTIEDAAPGALGDGFALQFSREDWGVIFDGVMLEIDRSEKRKQANSESNSDARAEQGRVILAAIRARSSAPGTPEAPAENRHPLQPLVEDARGTVRFKANAIIVHLTRDKLNDLASMDFSTEDREQLAQLIGYSLGGFAELSYVTDETYDRAAAQPVVPRAAQLDGGQGEGERHA